MKEKIMYYYQGDESLIEKFHVLAPTTLEEAAQHTADSIQSILTLNQHISVFKPEWYAIVIGEHLFAFCIRKEFRGSHKQEFTDFVRKHCKTAAVWLKNERGYNFLKSIGFYDKRRFNNGKQEPYVVMEINVADL